MTAEEARVLNDPIAAARGFVMWFIAGNSAGTFTARAMVADTSGGHQEGADLVADTIKDLRAMLPPGLTRRERSMVVRPEIVETWD